MILDCEVRQIRVKEDKNRGRLSAAEYKGKGYFLEEVFSL